MAGLGHEQLSFTASHRLALVADRVITRCISGPRALESRSHLQPDPLTCRLQEVRPGAPRALAAQIARVIALLTLAGLGLPGTPFHEPFHATSAWETTQLRMKNRWAGPYPPTGPSAWRAHAKDGLPVMTEPGPSQNTEAGSSPPLSAPGRPSRTSTPTSRRGHHHRGRGQPERHT